VTETAEAIEPQIERRLAHARGGRGRARDEIVGNSRKRAEIVQRQVVARLAQPASRRRVRRTQRGGSSADLRAQRIAGLQGEEQVVDFVDIEAWKALLHARRMHRCGRA
jgi:hypothetical protein